MLVATRDPMHQPGAHDPSSQRHDRLHAASAPHTSGRVLSFLQMAGSVLAIPVALGSAYTVYQTNFSPDTQCQQLRASIIAMIDKKIDAATRRMLVRRDVETFEKSCGAFDPDAKAAFVTLLQAESRIVPPRPVAAPKVDVAKPDVAKSEAPKVEAVKTEPVKTEAAKAEPAKVEAMKTDAAKLDALTKEIARKVEPRPAAPAVAKPVAPPPAAEAEAFDSATNDARWLDAVRGALLSHDAPRPPAEPPALKTTLAPSAPASAASPPVAAAPALPPATAIAAPVAPQSDRADPDHPVPPGAIPNAPPLDIAQAASGQRRSSWISNIPFVGQVLDK